MLIGILSDTHVPGRVKKLPEKVLRGLEGVDLILHAGDMVELSVVERLEKLAPVEAVAGNMDTLEVKERFPVEKELDILGVKIGLWHGHGTFSRYNVAYKALEKFPDADCIVFGHTHSPLIQNAGSKLLLNPGSPTDKRWEPYYSYALLEVEKNKIKQARLIKF